MGSPHGQSEADKLLHDIDGLDRSDKQEFQPRLLPEASTFDILGNSPLEIAHHILSFIDDYVNVWQAQRVSKTWRHKIYTSHALRQAIDQWLPKCDPWLKDAGNDMAAISHRAQTFHAMRTGRSHSVSEIPLQSPNPDRGAYFKHALRGDWIAYTTEIDNKCVINVRNLVSLKSFKFMTSDREVLDEIYLTERLIGFVATKREEAHRRTCHAADLKTGVAKSIVLPAFCYSRLFGRDECLLILGKDKKTNLYHVFLWDYNENLTHDTSFENPLLPRTLSWCSSDNVILQADRTSFYFFRVSDHLFETRGRIQYAKIAIGNGAVIWSQGIRLNWGSKVKGCYRAQSSNSWPRVHQIGESGDFIIAKGREPKVRCPDLFTGCNNDECGNPYSFNYAVVFNEQQEKLWATKNHFHSPPTEENTEWTDVPWQPLGRLSLRHSARNAGRIGVEIFESDCIVELDLDQLVEAPARVCRSAAKTYVDSRSNCSLVMSANSNFWVITSGAYPLGAIKTLRIYSFDDTIQRPMSH